MYIRRSSKILELFLKYAERSKVITPIYVSMWYLLGDRCASTKMVLMLRQFIREGILSPKCEKCFIRDMLNACCYS